MYLDGVLANDDDGPTGWQAGEQEGHSGAVAGGSLSNGQTAAVLAFVAKSVTKDRIARQPTYNEGNIYKNKERGEMGGNNGRDGEATVEAGWEMEPRASAETGEIRWRTLNDEQIRPS